jgi:hypothetical protein
MLRCNAHDTITEVQSVLNILPEDPYDVEDSDRKSIKNLLIKLCTWARSQDEYSLANSNGSTERKVYSERLKTNDNLVQSIHAYFGGDG